jgi:ligand-binding sensor domain-containing protein/signal transduction histidine kinase
MTVVLGSLWLTGCGSTVPGSSPSPSVSPTTQPEQDALNGVSVSSAPAANIRFMRIGVQGGLSQSAITCILQDEQGFLWFGTQDGLNRFDGYTFKIFRPDVNDPASINDRWINSLFQDRQGFLWIGTRLGGLNRYDPVSEQFSHYINDPANPSSLVNDRVQVVFEDRQGRLWVGTSEGLDRFSPSTNTFEHLVMNGLPGAESGSEDITAIVEDKNGTLWIGTAYAGLYHYKEGTGTFVNYSSVTGNPSSLSSNRIRAIQGDPSGDLWVATDDGLNLFDPHTGLATRFLHSTNDPGSLASNSIHAVYLDGDGNAWIGTRAGLDRYDRSTRSFIHYKNDPDVDTSLSSDTISAIGETSDSVLWIGTYGEGLNKYYRGQDRFAYYHFNQDDPNNPGGNNVRAVAIDHSGDVWIGTFDGGLNRLDPVTGSITNFRNDPSDPGSLGSNEVRSVYFDSSGNLWVGTSAGVDILKHGTLSFSHFLPGPVDRHNLSGSPVVAIAEDRAKNIWLGTELGLEKYDHESGIFTRYQNDPGNLYSISGNEIESLLVDLAGDLWIGTLNDGLNRYDLTSGQLYRYQHDPSDPGSISKNSILSIHQDRQGTLWVGTDGGGLNRFDPAGSTFLHYGEEDGLPNSVIFGIQEDKDGFLWLSTNNGLSRFDPDTGKSLRNYTVDDGLQGNEFNTNAFAGDALGRLYFGGVNGLTAFLPGQIHDSLFLPPVVLLSISEDGIPVDGGTAPSQLKEITLRWPQRSFEFEYSALSYAQPAKNQYAYMLSDYDEDWNLVGGRREGRYNNLPGGDYVLRIKASNQDGIWNETGTSVRVTVLPPFWQTVWFRFTIAGVVIVLGLSAYWWRIKSIQAYNRDLENQVRDRTQEIEKLFEKTKDLAVIEERNRLARELHDSAKQKAFAALAQLGTANGILKKNPRAAKNHLVEAENLVYEVIEELTFLIQEMYPISLKERGLAATLREYVFEWEARTDIQADVTIADERQLSLDIEQALYRVVQEALSNVSRHSHADHIEVVLTYASDMVTAVIADNGCGFDVEAKASGMGLRSIRERIESLGGVVEIESLPDCGTRLTVRLPARII